MRRESRRRRVSSRKRSSLRERQLPLCRVLQPQEGVPADSAGVVLIRQLQEFRPGRYAFSILAHNLPAPEEMGSFDQYQGLVFIPEVITWVFALYPTPETPPTWAGTLTQSTLDPTPSA